MILFLAGIILLACVGCAGNGQTVRSDEQENLSQDSQGIPSDGLTSDGQEKESQAGSPQPDTQASPSVSVDVDLTALSSTMVYAEVYNMMVSPNDYIGKNIRMTGIFTVYQDPETARIYCGVIVEDATACCAQGFNLVMPEGLAYPQDYPPSKSEVTVVGELQADRSLEERGIILLHLEHVKFESSGGTP
ncbi:MAG: hypothetical protein MSB10_05790 [Clostridiales bacterium]|nr:hypothetical protein [Clostridiales bacterium]